MTSPADQPLITVSAGRQAPITHILTGGPEPQLMTWRAVEDLVASYLLHVLAAILGAGAIESLRDAAERVVRERDSAQARVRELEPQVQGAHEALDAVNAPAKLPGALPARVRRAVADAGRVRELATELVAKRAEIAALRSEHGDAEAWRALQGTDGWLARSHKLLSDAGVPNRGSGFGERLDQRIERLVAQADRAIAERDAARRLRVELAAELGELKVDGPATEALAEVRRILGAAKGEGAARAAHRVMGTGSTIPARPKVGDRVRVLELHALADPERVGRAGTLVEDDGSDLPFRVRLDEPIDGQRMTWAVRVEVLAPAEAQPAIKVGDRVRVLEGAPWSRAAEGKMGKVEAVDDNNDRERYRVIFDDLIELQGGPETNSAWVRRVELCQLMRCVTPDAHAGTYAAPAGFVGALVYQAIDGTYKLQGKDAKARWAATIEPVGKARVGDRVRITEAGQSTHPEHYWDESLGRTGTLDSDGWVKLDGAKHRKYEHVPAAALEVLPS